MFYSYIKLKYSNAYVGRIKVSLQQTQKSRKLPYLKGIGLKGIKGEHLLWSSYYKLS